MCQINKTLSQCGGSLQHHELDEAEPALLFQIMDGKSKILVSFLTSEVGACISGAAELCGTSTTVFFSRESAPPRHLAV